MRRIAIAALALLLVAPTADAGTNLARDVARALHIAKRADKHATAALRTARVGPIGPRGTDGQNGAPGRPGVDGATGATGAKGDVGPVGPSGPAGADGHDGIGSSAMSSTANVEVVRFPWDFAGDRAVLASLSFSRPADGQSLVIAEGQFRSVPPNAGTAASGTPLTCEVDLDGAAVATREFDLGAGATTLATVTAAPAVGKGAHMLEFICARPDGVNDARVEVAQGRARLSVLG